jgi:hypothetical protein
MSHQLFATGAARGDRGYADLLLVPDLLLRRAAPVLCGLPSNPVRNFVQFVRTDHF